MLWSGLVDDGRDRRLIARDTWNLVLSSSLSTPHHGHTPVTYTHQHPTELVGPTKEGCNGSKRVCYIPNTRTLLNFQDFIADVLKNFEGRY